MVILDLKCSDMWLTLRNRSISRQVPYQKTVSMDEGKRERGSENNATTNLIFLVFTYIVLT